LDIDEGIVEQAKFMGIDIIWKAGLKNVSARSSKSAFWITVHHRGDGGTLQTDELWGEVQEMLTEFQGLFGEQTIANSQDGRQADLKIKMVPYGKIPFRSPYRISWCGDAELRRLINMVIRCGWT